MKVYVIDELVRHAAVVLQDIEVLGASRNGELLGDRLHVTVRKKGKQVSSRSRLRLLGNQEMWMSLKKGVWGWCIGASELITL